MSNPRLEELRTALRAENISYGELAELQDLASEIDPGDVELLEAAGVPEFPEDDKPWEATAQVLYDDGSVGAPDYSVQSDTAEGAMLLLGVWIDNMTKYGHTAFDVTITTEED